MGRKYTERKNAAHDPDAVEQQRQAEGNHKSQRHDERREDREGDQTVQERAGLQQVDVVLQPDPVARGNGVLGTREAQDHRPHDRHVDEDHQTDDQRPDEQPERACHARDPASGLACRRGCARRRRHQGRDGHVSRTAESSSALTAFSALARFASMSPPLRTIAVAASAYALFIFGVQAGLPATA